MIHPLSPNSSNHSRRDFIITAGAMAAVAASARAHPGQPADPKASPPAGPGTPAVNDQAGKPAVPLERRPFGNTDMQVTVLGFGGAEIGYRKTDQDIIDKLLNSALDAGLNVIDTAECYLGSEESIG